MIWNNSDIDLAYRTRNQHSTYDIVYDVVRVIGKNSVLVYDVVLFDDTVPDIVRLMYDIVHDVVYDIIRAICKNSILDMISYVLTISYTISYVQHTISYV
jgi:hypothetical protein